MAEAFICEPYRTAFGRFGGQFRGISAHELAAQLLLREMDRRQAQYGLETMCIGGGQGLAAVFERVSP